MPEGLLSDAAKDIETKFKVALIEHQMTQVELAGYLNVDPAQVSRAIKGDISPKSQRIREQAAKILDIT